MLNTEYYSDLADFVRAEIAGKGKVIRPQELTTSTRREILECFKRAGWKETNRGTRPFRRSFSPRDNSTCVQMVDGKLYRHSLAIDQITKRKDLTRRFLEASNVPVPVGADFSLDEEEAATLFFLGLDKTVVTKPSNLGGSRGVSVGISSPEKFRQGWTKALKTRGASRILVEEHIRGIELRLFVIGESVAAAAAKVQPFIIGDGKRSVSELVAVENDIRSHNFRHRNHPIVPEINFLRDQGYEVASIVPANEVVFLSPFTVLRAGAIYVDVTNTIADEVKSLAVRATKAIPTLEIAGVDVLIKDIQKAETAKVLEVNTAPAIDIHRFPSIGNPVALPELMVGHFLQS